MNTCDVRQGRVLREFRRWRIYPRPAPGKRAFRSSGGVCEPMRLQADASPIPRAESAKIEPHVLRRAAGKCPTGISPLGKGTNEKSKALELHPKGRFSRIRRISNKMCRILFLFIRFRFQRFIRSCTRKQMIDFYKI